MVIPDRRGTVLTMSAGEVVTRQVEAYNAADLGRSWPVTRHRW